MSLFDNINLPDELGNKTAALDLSPNGGDGDAVVLTDPSKVVENAIQPPVTPATPDPAITATPPATPDPDKKIDEQPAEKLTPFHEHPDWKKMQEKNESQTAELNQLKGQIDALMKTQNAPSAAETKAAVKTTEERLQEDVANGWQPQSQMDIALRQTQYLREEMEAKAKAESERKEKEKNDQNTTIEEARKEFTKAVDDAFTPFSLSGEQEKLVSDQISAWRDAGTVQLNARTIGGLVKTAHELLTAQGKLTATPAPATPPADPEKDKKKEVAQKIVRNNSNNNNVNANQKKPIADLHKSLDEIVAEQGSMLAG